MSEANGDGHSDTTKALIDLLVGELTEIQARATELGLQLAEVHVEERKYQTALRALVPDHELLAKRRGRPPKVDPGPGAPRTLDRQDEWALDPAKFAPTWDWIKGQHDRAFTRADVIAAMEGIASSHTVGRILHRLRNVEAIRLVGTRKAARGQKSQAYKVMSADAGDKAVAENDERAAANPRFASKVG